MGTLVWRRARHGIDDRYAGTTLARAVHAELAHEMETVEHLGFAAYFLTVARVADLIRGMGVRVQAHGSGVGTVLNYGIDLDVESTRRFALLEPGRAHLLNCGL